MPTLTPGESIAAANYLGDAVTEEILQGYGLSSAPALLLERLALAYAAAYLIAALTIGTVTGGPFPGVLIATGLASAILAAAVIQSVRTN